MYSGIVFIVLFFAVLFLIWLFLVGAKSHKKLAEKTENFIQTNLVDEKEND